HLTDAGRELRPLIEGFGVWGQRWIESEISLQNLDVSLLMWDMRRRLNPDPMPRRRTVIQFRYAGLPAARRDWWLVVDPKTGADLCSVDPGHDVDLYVATDLRTMTAIWMGLETVRKAVGERRLSLTGDRKLAADIQSWLGLSICAPVKRAA
nr:transcriptional regulator [Alphaproteobacteria bacterium]